MSDRPPTPELPDFGGISAEELARNMQDGLAALPTTDDLNQFIQRHQPDIEAEQRTRQQMADWLGVDVDRIHLDWFPVKHGPALPAYRIDFVRPRWKRALRRIIKFARRTR